MEAQKSITSRRIGVILTFASLAALVILFEYCKSTQWTPLFIALGILSLIVLGISFALTFVKSGLWGFTHKALKKLDEREIALTSKNLRYAYAIFSIFVLLLLFIFALTETPIDMLMVAALLLFAHLLPAAILAWTEKGM